MLWLIGPTEPVNPGDVFEVRFSAQDNRAIERLTVRVTGAFDVDAEFEFPEPEGQFTLIVTVPVPEGARLDVPAHVTLIVADKAGLTAEKSTDVQMIDTWAPGARLDFGGLRFDGTIRTGESFEIFVSGADNHQLTYIGYEGAGIRDSVPASGTGDFHAFRLTVPDAWLFSRPGFTAWARDASGHVRGSSTADLQVYNWVDHPVITVPILTSEGGRPTLWDAKRSALYMLRYGSEENAVIDVIDVQSGPPPVTIPISPRPNTFAFSATGDSLVLTFPANRTLGVVDLTKPVRTVTSLPLLYGSNRIPFWVQAAGNRLFVALGFSEDGGQLLDVNLGTGSQVIRNDLDGATRVSPQPVLLPLPNGRMYVGTDDSYSCDDCFVYSSSNDQFTRTSWLSPGPKSLVTSPSGRYIAVYGIVFNAALDSVASAPTWDWVYPKVMAFSHDDQAVYQATWYGYQKVRLSDGRLLEQVKLGFWPLQLIASADGSRLIAINNSKVMIIDLR